MSKIRRYVGVVQNVVYVSDTPKNPDVKPPAKSSMAFWVVIIIVIVVVILLLIIGTFTLHVVAITNFKHDN